MTTPTHLHDFKPCEAVQYDGTNANRVHQTAGGYFVYADSEGAQFAVTRDYWPTVLKGQWLVRQGGRVWVQDEEPARVERWMLGEIPSDGRGWSADEVWELQSAFHEEATHRRPVLSNGWVGPWEECG